MSTSADLARLSVAQFRDRFRNEMIPLSNHLAYFAALPLGEEEIKDYLHEPVAALPPAVQSTLPKIAVFLVPYLEKANGKSPELVTFERPPEKSQTSSAQFIADDEAVLVFGIKDQEVADYHYVFYNGIAWLVAEAAGEDVLHQYYQQLREELGNSVHGEVDEKSWRVKQALLRQQANFRRETKLFRSYARQSFIDTLTLYLHGICCDIDIETGPRQLPSRHLRKRLLLLESIYPPPEGYAVLPEELKG